MTRSIFLVPDELAECTFPSTPEFSQVAKLSSCRTTPVSDVRAFFQMYFDDLVAVEHDACFFSGMGERSRMRREHGQV